MTTDSFMAYIMAVAFSLGFLIIAAIISSLIKFEGGSNPKDKRNRKICFWTFAALIPELIFSVGFFLMRSGIKIPSKQVEFTMHLGIATAVGLILYVLLGFILSRIFKNGKIGHWF